MPMQPIAFAQLEGRTVGQPQPTQPTARRPGGTMPTADGMAFIAPVEPAHWATLLRLIGDLDWAADEVEDNPRILVDSSAAIGERMRAWALEHTSNAISDLCQAAHVPVAPVCSPAQVVRDAHLRARNLFRGDEMRDHPGLHLPILATTGAAGDSARSVPTNSLRPPGTNDSLPLAGMRILDLSWAWAGPFATALLADLGAEVINVEWHPRASNIRRNPPFAHSRGDSNNTAAWWSANQRGKFSIGVNLKSPAGRQVVHDLAAISDVVVENFSPGTVDRLGVGYDDLKAANPRIVYVSLSAFGQSGPRSHYIGYGTQVYAAAGASYATSQDGQSFSQMFIPYPDPVSGLGGAFAVAAFVNNVLHTRQSAKVDVSELEVVTAVALEPLLDALAEQASSVAPTHSRRYTIVTSSDGKFVALLARSEDEWEEFAKILDTPDANARSLQEAAHPLTAKALIDRFDTAQLIAVPIQDSSDVLADPYLKSRDFWVTDRSPEVEDTGVLHGASIWHLNGKRAEIWRGAPPLFSDTRTVLDTVLRYDSGRIEDLFEAGAVE